MPKSTIIIVEQNGDGSISTLFNDIIYHNVAIEADYFCKSKILNSAINDKVDSKYIIMVDNDCILPSNGIELLETGLDNSSVFIPFRSINKLNEANTRQLVKNGDFIKVINNSPLHVSRYTGGFNLFTKETFDTVGGFDDEFQGWGAEDDAFLTKCQRIVGNVKRTMEDVELVHLYHPSENKPDYLQSDQYMKNKKMLACLKRMTYDDLIDYTKCKPNSIDALAQKVDIYEAKDMLDIMVSIDIGNGTITMDTTAYNVTCDENGKLTLDKILEAIYNQDNLDFVLGVIAQIESKLTDLPDNVIELLDYYKSLKS